MTELCGIQYFKKEKYSLFCVHNFSDDIKDAIIDEAHSLLHDDRNMLLASVILVLEKRNPDTVFKFLTPFLCDANNIKVRYAGYSLKTYKVDEYIKTEKLYVAELRDKHAKKFYLYDQFINKFYKIDELTTTSEWDFVNGHSGLKNIIYFNKPKDIESFVQIMISERQEILDEKILEACKNIAEYVHPDYRLIECVKRGVNYHHGAVPEPVRMYIERLYAELNDIKYVVTSSTLLEGLNLPADKMFIMDNKKGQSNLSPSDFKNLIGRVCRFSQIFDRDTESLTKLEPKIYLVVGRYFSANANAKKFIQDSMYVEKTINDELKNVLLEKTTINQANQDKFENAQEFIENYEGGIIQDYSLRKVKTETGKICFMNNITEFDIFSHEEGIEKVSKRIKENGRLIDNTNVLFETLNRMFFSKITDDNNIKQFDNEETRRFYKMFLDWRISNTSLNQSSILNIEATTNQNVAAIVIEHGYINPKFLWYWLQKEYKKNREKGAGSGPQALNCQRVRELGFIVPSIEEQNEIVNILERLLENEEQVVSAIEGVIEQVADIKKSILAKAFRGELETNNPEEKSSIELLKKIITEN